MITQNKTKTVLTFAIMAMAISLLAVTSASAALIDGLVEYWQLNENYNAELTPEHEGTLTTTGTGSGTFVTGKFDKAIDLENSASNQAYVVIGGVEDNFDFAGESMSVSLWYTTKSLYTSWQCLVAKGEGSSWRLHRNSNSTYGSTETDINFHTSINVTGDGELDQQDGSWHHVVATADAINGGNLYVDGNLVDSVSGAIAIAGNTAAMQIGGNPGAAGRGWDGILDDVAIWNRALNADEVSDIWNGGTGVSIGLLTGITDPNAPSVDAGPDMISWSGQEVQLAPTVVNNDSEVPQRTLSYLWSAEPVDDVVFSPSAIVEVPTVTITKATANPSLVKLTLAVTLEGGRTMSNTMTIDLYDDACLATKAAGTVLDPTDIDENCVTNLADLAGLAETWLEDYTLAAPAPKPVAE